MQVRQIESVNRIVPKGDHEELLGRRERQAHHLLVLLPRDGQSPTVPEVVALSVDECKGACGRAANYALSNTQNMAQPKLSKLFVITFEQWINRFLMQHAA